MLQRQLTAMAQIYFQDSPVFGAVLLFCLYLSGPALALGCVLGVGCASVAACALKFPEGRRHNGLYGFNGALTGIGLCATYQLGGALLIWGAMAGVLTAMLTRLIERMRIPPLTLPFVLSMWLAAAVGSNFGLQGLPRAAGICGATAFTHLFCSLGEAAFIGPAPLGMLLWTALARRDWNLAMWALSGAALSWLGIMLASWLLPASGVEAHAAGAGINSLLAALALHTHQCRWPWRLAGTALSFALAAILGVAGLPCFTAPFILATWLVLLTTHIKVNI
ncbi:hypothetical protein GTP81_03905 [Rugamonas sp. FT107W]|uniref:Urea transporter n=1 Tax=Duganella vulcania TaxID=2692166 RepID=A0A845HB68_9BURK|nr:hypothetical protein [Duganella vulcania]